MKTKGLPCHMCRVRKMEVKRTGQTCDACYAVEIRLATYLESPNGMAFVLRSIEFAKRRASSIIDVNAADILLEGANTYRERNKLYGDNYKNFGKIMVALFPDGLTVQTVQEWNRLGVFLNCQGKLTRYALNLKKGGHKDSAHDSMVYSAMLEELTS